MSCINSGGRFNSKGTIRRQNGNTWEDRLCSFAEAEKGVISTRANGAKSADLMSKSQTQRHRYRCSRSKEEKKVGKGKEGQRVRSFSQSWNRWEKVDYLSVGPPKMGGDN